MSIIRIALLQMAAHGDDQQANLEKGEAFCRRAREMGADIALFPEMWSIGYANYCAEADELEDIWRGPDRWKPGKSSGYEALREARERWQAQAVPRDGAYVNHFRALARELGMAIAMTYLEQWP